jgi:hypothetical protein
LRTRAWKLVAVGIAGAAALVPGVPAIGKDAAKPFVITEQGVRGLRLGRPLAKARTTGLIGATTPGCELATPRPIGAQLKSPLRGFATFGGGGSHPLQALSVRKGVITVRHIAVGATAAAVRNAYPQAHLLTSKPDDAIQLTALIVRRNGKDKMWFLLDKVGGHVTEIDVPAPQICE